LGYVGVADAGAVEDDGSLEKRRRKRLASNWRRIFKTRHPW
jgi:hypothetical protein